MVNDRDVTTYYRGPGKQRTLLAIGMSQLKPGQTMAVVSSDPAKCMTITRNKEVKELDRHDK